MNSISIVALGGLDENGKNMYCIEVDSKIFIVNCGIKRYEDNQFGVDYIIPDFSYVIENKSKVAAVIITHAHDDMMEALPYLIKSINVPIYAPQASCVFIRSLMKENDIKDYHLYELPRSGKTIISQTKITTFALTHATPDAVGVAIDTPKGQIVVAEQYVIDFDQQKNEFAGDVASIADVGRNGVLCALIESSYAGKPSFTSPKHRITPLIRQVFEDTNDRIIFMVYGQNFFRIREIVDLAYEYHRPIYCLDKEFNKNSSLYSSIKSSANSNHHLTNPATFDNENDNAVILVTGYGAKIFENMTKIATGEDERIELRSSDTIVIASPVVSGTEKEASTMENELYKNDIKIIKLNSKEVLSMHPSNEDIKMLLSLLRPTYFLPVMGSYRNFIDAANLALEIGYTPDKVIILDNGQVALFEEGRLKSCANVIENIGETLINDKEKKDVTSFVIKDRELLSTDGVIVIGVAVDFNTKKVIGGPDIQSRGVIYVKDSEYLIKNIAKIVVDTIKEKVENGVYTNLDARVDMREKISRYVLRETGKRPMILPAIIEINI